MPVMAHMATIPARRAYFAEAFRSIAAQTVAQFVYFDRGGAPADLSAYPAARSVDGRAHGALGAGGKFYAIQRGAQGRHLICDDDLVYPPGYSEYMTERLAHYRRKHGRAIVGMHAWSFPTEPKHHHDRRDGRHCLRGSFAEDAYVNVLGTGTMCLHADDLDADFAAIDFTQPKNLVDLKVAVWAQRQRVHFVSVARPPEYFRYLLPDHVETVWHQWWAQPRTVRYENAQIVMRIVRQVPEWRIFT